LTVRDEPQAPCEGLEQRDDRGEDGGGHFAAGATGPPAGGTAAAPPAK
jgi:hypothetical protein